MSVGIFFSKVQVDGNAGQIVMDIENAFARIDRMKTWLDGTLDATLQASPYNYTAGEVATLKSAYTDLAQLLTLYRGTATLGSAKDFRTFARQLWGAGL